jgi:hypothetical protein
MSIELMKTLAIINVNDNFEYGCFDDNFLEEEEKYLDMVGDKEAGVFEE